MNGKFSKSRPAIAVLVTLLGVVDGGVVASMQVEQKEPGTSRDARVLSPSQDGRLQLVAVRSLEPVLVDGVLDDEVWAMAEAASSFVQSEPLEGEPATEVTEVRVAFDDNNLYIAAHCYDREPGRIVTNEIRQDFQSGTQDTFEVVIDTFSDRRNGFLFRTNPAGARSDEQVTNEGREVNASWDAVWHVRSRVVSDGWVAEIAIPFKQLRFDLDRAPVWGVNFSRQIRRKNEVDYWSPVPRTFSLNRVSEAGELVGLPSAHAGRNLRVKPYAAARTVRDTGGDAFSETVDVGVDVKYGITPALTLDVTANPDFAQVEADEQQVNLTQFSQFFPEQREFFLENSGIFYIGDAAVASRVNRGGLAPRADTDLLPFFSRRIGLSEVGVPIPIRVGARLTGNVGGVGIGALTAQVEGLQDTPANNYSVIRLRRNVSRSSDVGAIFMMRQSTSRSGDYNRVYGGDATFRFFGNMDWSSYALWSDSPGLSSGQYAYRSTINRDGRFFHIKTGLMSIGDNFRDDLGFLRRVGIRKYIFDTGIRPRFDSLRERGVREMHPHVVWNYFTDHSGRTVAKQLHSGYTFFFNNGGLFELAVNTRYELLEEPFKIHFDSPPIPPGGYGWNEYQLWLSTDASRPVSASIRAIGGGLWSGTQRTLQATVTVKPSYSFRAALGLQRTDASLDLPRTDFVTSIWTLRANYSFNTNMFLDSLVQYQQDRGLFNANIRFNFIHHPLSDLFVVYNEQRFTTPGDLNPPGRALIVKFTQMFSF